MVKQSAPTLTLLNLLLGSDSVSLVTFIFTPPTCTTWLDSAWVTQS